MKNIDRLAQIKTTDSLFWASLTDIAYLIKREGSTFIDDYALEVRSLPTIIICQTVKTETNSVLQNSDDGDTSRSSWMGHSRAISLWSFQAPTLCQQ